MMIPWQEAPINGSQRFVRSAIMGSRTATAVVSHGEHGWTYRIYLTDVGAFEERLYHASRQITTSRTQCMRNAYKWMKVAVGLAN